MIRYLALAFIFFQVATTTALATQVVLFEDAQIAIPVESMSGAPPAQPISALVVGEMARREDATEHLLIQIDNGNIPARRP
ncbi:exported hypothetical protein [Mesorhizobium plurifarium]|uniref:Uncharacterized protein n=1 Tax=Mesorhizobium plurifarium TaxID=69974 RepID=A0A0K2VX82_MESPL|nr:exported hypothetical protein [Mesorhizobium plurifarium]